MNEIDVYNPQIMIHRVKLDKKRRLTPEQVIFIRSECKPGVKGRGIIDFARAFNVGVVAIRRALTGATYKDVEEGLVIDMEKEES